MRAAACALTLVCLALSSHASDVAPPSPPPTPLFSNLPLLFVENRGQLDGAVRFSVPGSGRTLFFARDGITVALEGDGQRWALKLDFVDANPDVILRGDERQQAVFSYFKGNDPAKWKTGCPTYSEIAYENLWPGIDLVYRGEVNRLKHEFVVAPGADPQRIRFGVRGATVVRLAAKGDLVLETPLGSFEDARPIAYQERDGVRTDVAAAFALDGTRVTFALGAFDPTLPLVLDPETIVYSGFLGGSSWEWGQGIAVDLSGATYVSGNTNSSDFPIAGGWDPTYNGNGDVLVAKVDAAGTALVYSGFLGGSSFESGHGIAVDLSGAAYVTGFTQSTDFPCVGPLDPTYNGGNYDGFIAKLDPTGSTLVYSGYFGGNTSPVSTGGEWGNGIAVDASGAAYVAGWTESLDFPTVGPLGPNYNGNIDAFILKVDPAGDTLLYSGFLGGADGDESWGRIAVDATGAAYLTGLTRSSDFPAVGGLDPTYNGGWPDGDAFVAKVGPEGSALVYSGFLGGSSSESGHGVAVDASGAAYVIGRTNSTDFPTVGGLDPSYNGGEYDAFVAKVDSAGNALVYSGFLGGSGRDSCADIAVDAGGAVSIAGGTNSSDFPTCGGLDPSYNGGSYDAYLAKIDASGGRLLFSGYLGGSLDDRPYGIALDASGAAYMTGVTYSPDFPTVGPLDPTLGGTYDGFVTKIFVPEFLSCRWGTVGNPDGPPPTTVLRINGNEGDADRLVVVTIGSPLTITMDVPPSGPIPAPFAMYGWVGEPSESTATPHPKGVGTMCFPTPVTGGLPQPNRIWNNIGHFGILGTPHLPSEPAPSTVLSKPSGILFAITATFQGFILDDGSSARHPASITNAVILKVVP